MKIVYTRALQGCLLSLGAPLGWLAIRFFTVPDILVELQQNKGLYVYMLFGTMSVFVGFGVYVGRKQEQISDLAIRDSLTGVYNIRFYIERLKEEIANTARYQSPLSLIYLDLDHFKKVNDQHGHPTGDEVLRRVTAVISDSIRVQDVFARVGGEEFALLLPRCHLSDAKKEAERLRCAVESLQMDAGGGLTVEVTISLGVVGLQNGETLSQFYERADRNLYLAKHQGRNQVVG